MTTTGRVTSIERRGLATRENSNVLLRVGFSNPLQTLEEAALNAMEDKVYGFAGSLILGTVPRYGSLYNQYYINTEFVKNNLPNMEDYLAKL